jgi:hypothetical protein
LKTVPYEIEQYYKIKSMVMKIDQLWNNSEEQFERSGDIKDILRVVGDYPSYDEEYAECLSRGGIHLFSKALRIFGLTNHKDARNILRWNNPDIWKSGYALFFKDVWAFAEDVFGFQYLFYKEGVGQLDIETGKINLLCKTFKDWIALVMENRNYYSGFSVAQEWGKVHADEPLTGAYHLSPVTLFVCNGGYEIDNFFRIEAEQNLCVKAQIARQLKDVPDGTQIKFKFE